MSTLIGVVTGTILDKNKERIAWIRPLVEVTGSGWEEVQDPEQQFPARGSIFWPRATLATKDALIHFRAKENSIRKEGGDDYMVADPQPALEVLDLRSVGTCEQVRIALNSGIQVPGHPNSRLLIWCKGNFVVGPVSLLTGINGLTTTEKKDRARIHCFQFKEAEIRQISFEGITRSIVARSTLGPPQSYVDWDDDKQVMRRAIEYAVTKSAAASIDFPKHMIEEAAEHLTKSGSSPDLQLELYRLERSRSLVTDLKKLASVSEEIVSVLRKHPSVAKEIEQLKAAERDKARNEAVAALAAEREALEKIKKEYGVVESALSSAKRRLDEADASVREQTRDIEAKIQRRIVEVLDDAPAFLANVALLKPFLAGKEAPEQSPEISVGPWKVGTNKISNAKELRARIIPAFKAMGVPTTAYQPIHAAFAGGLLPVVSGSRALEALHAYAHVVTGGRRLVVQATSALADVQDIFGRVMERRFVPHAAGLIDVVRAARKSDGLFLVILDGINRGATESYLLPLIRAALRRTTGISLFHPSAVEAGDPYRLDARVEWPKNLLLAVTVIEGPTTLPVAPDLWSDSVLIQTDLEGAGAIPTGLGSDASEVSPSSGLLASQPSFENLEWIQEVVLSAQAVAGRFEGGLRTVLSDMATIQQSITKCILVPHLASIEDEEHRRTLMKAIEKVGSTALEPLVLAARRSVS